MTDDKSGDKPPVGFWKTPLGLVAQAVIGATALNTAIQGFFPIRAGAWTAQDAAVAAEVSEKADQVINSRVTELHKELATHTATAKLEMERFLEIAEEQQTSRVKLWVVTNFLKNDTRIPPLHVEKAIDRALTQIDGITVKVDKLWTLIPACCRQDTQKNGEDVSVHSKGIPQTAMKNGN